MQARELSVFKFKLDKKIKKVKIENENGKTVQSEPLRLISDILQSAVYWCCLSCPLQLSSERVQLHQPKSKKYLFYSL